MKVELSKGAKAKDQVLLQIGSIACLNRPKGEHVIVWENFEIKHKIYSYGFNFENIKKYKLGETYKGHSGSTQYGYDLQYKAKVMAIITF